MPGFQIYLRTKRPARPVLLLLLFAAASWGQYAGSEACRACHASEYRSQSATGHASALAHSSANQPGEWAFGAGNQAITFVQRVDADNYLELAESWYRASNSLALTPGHRDHSGVKYRTFDPSAGIVKCFACHSTGYLRLADDGAITPSEAGVHCEACHGPGAPHAANPRLAYPRNPGRMNGVDMNALCGSCHRAQFSAEEADDLRDPWNSRHQPLLLAASACFQKSAGRLTCIVCHSPHRALDVTPASYNSACQSCHGNVRHIESVADRPCAECHMPSVRLNANLAFANHRIAVYRPGDSLSPVTAAASALPGVRATAK